MPRRVQGEEIVGGESPLMCSRGRRTTPAIYRRYWAILRSVSRWLFWGFGFGGFTGEAFLDGFEEFFHGEWLAEVFDDAQEFGISLVAAAFVGGDHDDGRGFLLALEVFQDGGTTHARHHHLRDDQVGR